MDVLQNFMCINQVEGVDDLGMGVDRHPSEFDPRWRQHREAEPDPFEIACPVVARKRDYRLVVLSSVAIVGFLGALAGVVPTLMTSGAGSRAAQDAGNSSIASASAPTQIPAQPQEPPVTDVAPVGWTSQQAYDQWSPKFDAPVSLY